MIVVARTVVKYSAFVGSYKNTEFKFFTDDDVKGIQDYVNANGGTFSFKKV